MYEKRYSLMMFKTRSMTSCAESWVDYIDSRDDFLDNSFCCELALESFTLTVRTCG